MLESLQLLWVRNCIYKELVLRYEPMSDPGWIWKRIYPLRLSEIETWFRYISLPSNSIWDFESEIGTINNKLYTICAEFCIIFYICCSPPSLYYIWEGTSKTIASALPFEILYPKRAQRIVLDLCWIVLYLFLRFMLTYSPAFQGDSEPIVALSTRDFTSEKGLTNCTWFVLNPLSKFTRKRLRGTVLTSMRISAAINSCNELCSICAQLYCKSYVLCSLPARNEVDFRKRVFFPKRIFGFKCLY